MKPLHHEILSFAIGTAFVFALVGGCAWVALDRLERGAVVEEVGQDTLATITRILQQDKKDCRLLDHWPDAPVVMLEAARKYDIDPYLLPAISRAEGPTPAMLKACNVYGLERRGNLLAFISHEYATDAAASILAGYKYRYEIVDGVVVIDTLAKIWCPANADLWAGNMARIYERGLCH
jgi:hypothetical protein